MPHINTMPTPKTKQPTTDPAAVPSRPNLGPFQLFLTDLFSELLTHSSTEDERNMMLFSLFSVFFRRRYSNWSDLAEQLPKRWKENEKDWLRKFEASKIPLVKLAVRNQTQKTIVDEVRNQMRGSLCADLQWFLDRSTPEEAALMAEVLTRWRSTTVHHEGELAGLDIATAFFELVDRNEYLFRVPDWMRDAVEQHMRWSHSSARVLRKVPRVQLRTSTADE